MPTKITTPLFSRILCLIDIDDSCLSALRLSRRLAERNDAVLSLMHIMLPRTPGGVVLTGEREQARQTLEKMVAGELDGIPYEITVRWGNPVKEILAAETELGVELCVMPIAGRMGTSHLFRRSVTERVALLSPCPVLAVGKQDYEGLRSEVWPNH